MFGVAAGSAAVMTHRHELCRLEDTERLFNDVRQLCGPSAEATKIA